MFASLLYTPHPPLEEYVYVVYLDIKLKVHVPVKIFLEQNRVKTCLGVNPFI